MHSEILINLFYAILCVKFVREVRYFTSQVAISSLSALVVRKVTGSEIIGCSVRKAMRKVPGDARRAARGRRKSGEERPAPPPGAAPLDPLITPIHPLFSLIYPAISDWRGWFLLSVGTLVMSNFTHRIA